MGAVRCPKRPELFVIRFLKTQLTIEAEWRILMGALRVRYEFRAMIFTPEGVKRRSRTVLDCPVHVKTPSKSSPDPDFFITLYK